MTERQEKLIEFLLTKDWVKQKTIYHNMQEYYEVPKGKNFHDTSTREQIAKDIRKINESNVPYVIVSSRKGVKIAEGEEAKIIVKSYIKATLDKLNRERRKLKKIESIWDEEDDNND